MAGKIKVGIVGTGSFSGEHIKAWRSIGKAELIGVHGSDLERLNAFSRKVRLKGYVDYASLIEECDLIDIVSANHTHYEYVSRALTKGVNVVVEKPLDINLENAKQIYRLSESNNVVSSVISQFRFMPCYNNLKKILRSGELGDIETCRVTVVWPRREAYFNSAGGWKKDKSRVGGGVLIHQCTHFIDLLHWYFGDAVAVFGKADYGNLEADKTIERSFWGEIEFENGVTCQLYCTTKTFPYRLTSLEFMGSKGTLSVNGEVPPDEGEISPLEKLKRYLRKDPAERPFSPLEYQLSTIINSILTGSPVLVTIKDGLTALRTVIGLYQASEVGRRVYLDDVMVI